MYYTLIEEEIEVLKDIAKLAADDTKIDIDILSQNVANILEDNPRLTFKQLKWWQSIGRKVGYGSPAFLAAAINEYIHTI